MNSVSCRNVKLGGFWKARNDINKKNTVPSIHRVFSETGRIDSLKCDWKEGMPNKPHFFWDSDVAKWIEAAAYLLNEYPDKELEKEIDRLIDLIEENQQDDGYFNVYHQTVEPENKFRIRDHHELYCAGHLIEAAVAYYDATGKDKLIRIMEKYVDLIYRIFVEEDSAAFSTPGHEEIELALIKLYDCTGIRKYLDLCAYFINTRGTSVKDGEIPSWADQTYYQSDIPVREFTFAEGHSVRACYLYSGMADLAAKTGDRSLLDACERVFDNIAQKQMYITGGIGATAKGEAFTEDYLLPNDLAYSETCAAISLAMFARRMSAIEPKSKYDDVAELAMYNCVLSGVSLDGKSFFYVNPLEINMKRHRQNELYYDRRDNLLTRRVEVFGCSCCPPNLARFEASIGDYIYTYDENTVYVHHFIDGSASEGGFEISQQTRYPNEGEVRITVKGLKGRNVAVRIPGWCAFASVNGEKITDINENGYAVFPVEEDEQIIDIWFDMPARLVRANPEVEDDTGKVCLCRGPLVYCAESSLNAGKRLDNIMLSPGAVTGLVFDDEMQAYAAEVEVYEDVPFDSLYTTYGPDSFRKTKIKMLPYFAFANHGESDMAIWLRIKG